MAAIDFPSSPVTNQVFTANNTSWQWDGTTWIAYKPTSGHLIFSGGTLDAGVVSTGSSEIVASSVLPNSLPSPLGNEGTAIVSNGNVWVAASTLGFSNVVLFSSTTTWTAPAGVTKVKATVAGAGGGGAGNGTPCPPTGAYGGTGGFGVGIYTVVPGTTYNITIGISGTGVYTSAGTTSTSTAGTTSSFGAFLSCTGGAGGSVTAAGVITGFANGVATGATLRSHVAFGNFAALGLLAGGNYGSLTTAPAVFSSTGGFSAGSGGFGNGTAAYGGVGGGIILEY